MLDLYALSETRRLEAIDLDRRNLQRAGWAERTGWAARSGQGRGLGRSDVVSVHDPWSSEALARLAHADRQAEAERDRLARQVSRTRRPARVVIAQALRALAARLDGDVTAARHQDRRLAGA